MNQVLIAMAIALVAIIIFYFALRLQRPGRLLVFFVLATAVALAPLLLPQEARVTRFCVALFNMFMVFKMWDLHVGAMHSGIPRLRELLGFVANLYYLVFRKRGIEPQPTTSKNLWQLALGLTGLFAAERLLTLMQKVDWLQYPFLLEHTLIATGLFLLVVAELIAFVAVTRLFGGYIVNAHDRPFAARTPADFWRRYNRLIGQFLYEDFFKLLRGRRHPVRATLGVFAVSGIFHEYLFWMATGQSPGLQLLFFMLQGGAVALTLRVKPTGWRAVTWGRARLRSTSCHRCRSLRAFTTCFRFTRTSFRYGCIEWRANRVGLRNRPLQSTIVGTKEGALLTFRQPIQRERPHQIRQQRLLVFAIHHQPIEHAQILAGAKRVEIGDGAHVYVWRVVPFVGQGVRDRHATLEQLPAMLPVAKIGKADDRLTTDAQHFIHHRFGAFHRLQGLREDDVIKGAIADFL